MGKEWAWTTLGAAKEVRTRNCSLHACSWVRSGMAHLRCHALQYLQYLSPASLLSVLRFLGLPFLSSWQRSGSFLLSSTLTPIWGAGGGSGIRGRGRLQVQAHRKE